MTIEKHERSTTDLVKAAVSGWLGTALEFMDFKSNTCQLFDKY
ncbi:transporter [Escherichia coli]|nr:transporter [Escherichia coli]